MSDGFEKTDLTLFKKKGPRNTTDCFAAVAKRMEELDLDHVVVASTTGETGARAVKFFDDYDFRVVVVTHQYGFKEDGEIKLEEEYRRSIEESENASLVVTPDILTRVSKIVRRKYQGASYLDVIGDTLKLFSEGMKVCVECVVQAADSGEIPVGEEVAVIAGTSSGADTGIILESQHSHKLLDIDIREVICIPRER